MQTILGVILGGDDAIAKTLTLLEERSIQLLKSGFFLKDYPLLVGYSF